MSDSTLYPACTALADVLSNFQKTSAELDEFRARVNRAGADEETVLADESLSEHEAVKRLGEAQKLKGIFAARAAHRERELAKLTTDLEQSCVPAERELIGLINEEVRQKSAAAGERVLAALDMDGDPSVISVELATIVRHSKAVRAVEELQPAGYYEPGNAEHLAPRVRAVLASLAGFKTEVAKGK